MQSKHFISWFNNTLNKVLLNHSSKRQFLVLHWRTSFPFHHWWFFSRIGRVYILYFYHLKLQFMIKIHETSWKSQCTCVVWYRYLGLHLVNKLTKPFGFNIMGKLWYMHRFNKSENKDKNNHSKTELTSRLFLKNWSPWIIVFLP